ncbi:MAG: GNAT family N-acetyltransferase [Brachymonas sp.]
MATVEQSTVEAITSDAAFPALAREYAAEADAAHLGDHPCATGNLATYRDLEAAGVVHSFAVRIDGALVGFAAVLLAEHPHFSRLLATLDTIFVRASARECGAGARLLAHIERFAREAGAAGMYVSAPAGGQLEQVMHRNRHYRQTNAMFFKTFKE